MTHPRGAMPMLLLRELNQRVENQLGQIADENHTVDYNALAEAQQLTNAIITTLNIYVQIFGLDDASQITDDMRNQLVACMPEDLRETWRKHWGI